MTSNTDNLTEAFVVRIWLERRDIVGAKPEWRGMIEHVTSGKQQYFLDLDSIVIVLADYLLTWGVRPRSWILLRERLRRLASPQWINRNRGTT